MRCVTVVLGWVFVVLFGLLSVPTVLVNDGLPAVLLALAALLCVPVPESRTVHGRRCALHAVARVILVATLAVGGIRLVLGTDAASIHASPGVRARLVAIYDEKQTSDQPATGEVRVGEAGQGDQLMVADGSEQDLGLPEPPAGE